MPHHEPPGIVSGGLSSCVRVSELGPRPSLKGNHMADAPKEWGHWPPTQERVNLVMRKALARQLQGDPKYTGVILLAEPKDAASFDACFGPTTQTVNAGSIYAIGANLGYLVEWSPSDDTGVVSEGRIEHEAFL